MRLRRAAVIGVSVACAAGAIAGYHLSSSGDWQIIGLMLKRMG